MANRPRKIGRPTLEEAGALQRRLVQRALDMLCMRGTSGLSMDALAKDVAVTKRTLYRHFPSKTALIEAVVDRELKRLNEGVDHNIEESTNALDALRSWSRHYYGYVTAPATRRFATFLSFESLTDEDLADRLQGWTKNARRPGMVLIAEAQQAGLLRDTDTTLTLLLLIDLLTGASTRIRHNDPPHLITGGLSDDQFFAIRWAAFLQIAGPDPWAVSERTS